MEPANAVIHPHAKYFAAWLTLALLMATGCKSPDMYYWGHYESVVYDRYAHPDKASPELLAAQLEEDLQKAASLNKPVPPGFHAQLGYLYAQEGKTDMARKEYEKEKQMYPESSVFMDRFLNNPSKK